MMKIGENFIQICRAVFKISRQMLLPWQYNFVLEKCVYFHDFQKKMLTFSLIISHNVPLLKIRAYIIKLADIYIYCPCTCNVLFPWKLTCYLCQSLLICTKITHFQLQFTPKASGVERDQ